jgi:hypothetical protein
MTRTEPRTPPGSVDPTDRSGAWIGQHVFVLDRVRIEVALEARKRYKYVRPRVLREGGGWAVVSPNCSRSIDQAGGEIAIAWLVPTSAPTPDAPAPWLLHARDHARACWVLKLRAPTLAEALERLVNDPLKEFWQ